MPCILPNESRDFHTEQGFRLLQAEALPCVLEVLGIEPRSKRAVP